MVEKIKTVLSWCILIFIFVGCNRLINTPDEPYQPDTISVNIDDLMEIKSIADNRNGNYSDLLDEISHKINEIIEYDRTMHEIEREQNEEKRQNLINEQYF